MRAFLAGFAAASIIAGIAALVLERFQTGSDVANTTRGAVLQLDQQGIKQRGW